MPDSAPLLLADRYQLDERLAAGGYGAVWRASDLTLSRPVAVKLLHAGFARHPETLTRFRAEARNAGAVTHENIARVYDYGEPPEAPAPFIVMELVEGASLQAVLADGPLEPDRVLDIVAQVAAGLDAAHRAGLVHRDIKPGNLLLGRDGIVKITDFGISHAAGSAPVTSTGQLVGTPGYLAPERTRGGQALPASDLYSLGVVAWECLSGKPPFSGDVMAVAAAHRDSPLPPLPAAVPAEVAALIAALTAKHLAFRPGSADDVVLRATQLRAWLTDADPGDGGGAGPGSAATLEMAALPGAALPAGDAGDAVGSGAYAVTGPVAGSLAGPVAGPVAGLLGVAGAPGVAGRRRAGRVAAVASGVAAIALIAGLVLASLLSPGSPQRRASVSSSAAQRPAAVTVDVSAGSMVGRPVPAVVRQLEQLGLRARVRWQVSDREPAGTVLSVLPGGQVPPGGTVTVTGALAPVRGPGHARQHPQPGAGKPGLTAADPGSGTPSPPATPATPVTPVAPTPPASGTPPPGGGNGDGGPSASAPPATPGPPATPASALPVLT